MWDLIVSVPDHCLSFNFSLLNGTFQGICQHVTYVTTIINFIIETYSFTVPKKILG